MKKTILIALMLSAFIVKAQWSNSSNNFTTGTVGIGLNNATLKMLYVQSNFSDHLGLFENINAGGYGLVLRSANDPLRIVPYSGSSNYLFVVNGNGNVGIGTTTPNGSLHVNGVNANAWVYFSGNVNGAGNPSNIQGLQFGWNKSGGAGESLIVYNTSLGSYPSLDFSSYNGTTFTKEMTLRAGNLGIGTTSPDAKLTVNGQVHAKEVKVDLNISGPDYVFEKDYPLTSLEDIKNYIDQNKHLPEVPSAKEMEKNGIQLGEMNMLLLKKIEELTLYMIELKREVQELKENQNTKK